jgi:opacity protein-like surface antigen
MSIRSIVFASAFATALAAAAPVTAQSFGIGPRLSFVRGHLPSNTPSSSLFGGTVRVLGSRHHAVELSLDTKTVYNEDRTGRMREQPLQASLLVFPVRSAVAPYLLGGFGVYRQTVETLNEDGLVLTSERTQKTGWHLGAGIELLFSRRVGLYGDYRFRFVRFGDPQEGDEPIEIPGLDSVKLSHRGSMWTGGIAFYF